MPISASDFIQVAKSSLENNGEGWTRNAISRAYYAMYHSGLLLTVNKLPHQEREDSKHKGVHARLSDYLCDARDAAHNDLVSLKKIGLMLKTAHAKRVAADYHLGKKINRIDALSVISDAEKVICLVDKLIISQTAQNKPA